MIKNTPPLGWNTWNTFTTDIDENLVRKSAEALVKSGLKDKGYEYIVIDDCWSKKVRDEKGRLEADPVKFPGGMKALSDYIHSLGLKFGMYSCAGTLTCAGYPSSFEHEFTDAATFAEWGVDYLKYDYCFHPATLEGKYPYRRMGTALKNCGREILFSACSWGVENTHEWIRSTGAGLWRSTGDIFDKWESVKGIIDKQKEILSFGGKGCFNDMDMLIVGMRGNGHCSLGGCTDDEYITHFSVWAMLQSPLMIGCDIRDMDDKTLEILGNEDVLKINQDALCAQSYLLPHCSWDGPEKPIFARLLENGDVAVCMINLTDNECRMSFTLDELSLNGSCCPKLTAKDLWTKQTENIVNETYFTNIKPHCCKLLRLSVVK